MRLQEVRTLQSPSLDPYQLNSNINGAINRGGRRNSNVINMLRIPGVHQVMLKVTVAELNRNALRSIGANTTIGGSGDVTFLSFATASHQAPLDQRSVTQQPGPPTV